MKKIAAALMMSFALMATAACGGGETDKPEQTQTAPTSQVLYNDSEVEAHLGMEPDSAEVVTPDGVVCNIGAILTSKENVDFYKEEGSVVATSADGTVGVEVGGAEQATCYDYVAPIMETFPTGAKPKAVEVPAFSMDELTEELNCEVDTTEALPNGTVAHWCDPYSIQDYSKSGMKDSEVTADAFDLSQTIGMDYEFVTDYVVVFGDHDKLDQLDLAQSK